MKKIEETESTIPIEMLPYLNKFKGKTFVIKYGGSVMKNKVAQEAFFNDVATLKNMDINIVIVHGGGPEISKWLDKIGIQSKWVNGLRVTDYYTMEIVEMVLSGDVNKKLSSHLSTRGLNAVGISGRDCNLIRAKKQYVYKGDEKIDIGFVGKIVNINKNLLLDFLDKNYIPVISPIGCDVDGNSYNINADFAAAFISGVLKAEKLIIMTDIEGVYRDINDPTTLLSTLTIEEIHEYIESGEITNGMIPKLECCAEAIEKGTKNVHLLDGRKEHSLILDLCSKSGTRILSGGGINKCQKIV
jgi:acetylglutamate kinase